MGARVVTQTRAMAMFLVEREERRTGSRMAAYDVVASSVGTSTSWLRKFIGRQDVAPDLVVGFNIRTLYLAWCSRVETEIENERALITRRRMEIDAVDLSALDVVEAAPRAQAPPKDD